MPIERIPDWEQRLARQDAFWAGEELDRPITLIFVRKPDPAFPHPAPKQSANVRDRWMDAEYVAERALADVMNTEYYGDALPSVWPNLGPDVFAAFFGCELEFGEDTSWSIPNLNDWSEVGRLRFSRENAYWRKLLEMTDALLEIGKGKFYTGLTDFHPGGDALGAFRDPQQLCVDLVESPDEVKKLLAYVTDCYLESYDFFCDKLTAAGQAIASDAFGITSQTRWQYVCNDFSYVISKEMFDDIFLPEIVRECRHFEACVYHLDGVGALRHLDSLLEIPEINMVQWVPGAGQPPEKGWIDLYRRCQAAGKGVMIWTGASDLDAFIENLRPKGVWLVVGGVRDGEHAADVLRKLSAWR